MNQEDLTRRPNLTQHGRGTGPLRTMRPVYTDFLPPCNNACPAGENIQAWLALAQDGHYEAAWQSLIENNPFPAIHGRVCYHPCEEGCNRNHTDTTVQIHAVERFLGDMALKEGWTPKFEMPAQGGRVLIVGAGPSGLSAAYHLRRMGHEVEIREAGPVAGGMIHFGIPAYRMPRQELNAEIKRVEDMGVKITLNHRVDQLLDEKKEGEFDAVFIAIGAHISKKINIPAREAGKMLDAVTFLRQAYSDNPPKIGRRVAIYGGGNTAMDAARTAKRLGAEEALIIYRRDRESMPAHDFEADEALEEGVKIKWLRTIKEIDEDHLRVEVMELDDQGRPQPTGKFEDLEADALIMAVGQEADSGFLRKVPGVEFNRDGTVIVGPDMMTGSEGIFAGGDMVPTERSVTNAVGHGKKAARYIDGYLRQQPYQPAAKHKIIGYDYLHLWFRTDAPSQQQPELPVPERIDNFNEIVKGLSEAEARYEAQRCLSCGNCFECDGCYAACPEGAIIKLGKGKRYRYDYDLCTGCAVCFEQCPCHAIEMVPEPGINASQSASQSREEQS